MQLAGGSQLGGRWPNCLGAVSMADIRCHRTLWHSNSRSGSSSTLNILFTDYFHIITDFLFWGKFSILFAVIFLWINHFFKSYEQPIRSKCKKLQYPCFAGELGCLHHNTYSIVWVFRTNTWRESIQTNSVWVFCTKTARENISNNSGLLSHVP